MALWYKTRYVSEYNGSLIPILIWLLSMEIIGQLYIEALMTAVIGN